MSPRSCQKMDESVISNGFLDSFDYVMTDCDGVLWIWNELIPGSVETIQALKDKGKHIIYITNNNTKSREDYLKKFDEHGFPATLNDIISSSYCAAAYLKNQGFQKKVYVFGSTGITQELEKANIRHLPIGPDPIPDQWLSWVNDLKLDPEVGAVIVGFDQHVSYAKLTKSASYVKNPDTHFIATNRDEKNPSDGNIIIPAAGTLVKAVEVVSGRRSRACGKPETFVLECIKENHPNIDFNRCIMIGDRLNTDILLGTRHGIKTLFVLSGIHTLEDVQEHLNSSDEERHMLVPDYYLPCLGDLLKLINGSC